MGCTSVKPKTALSAKRNPQPEKGFLEAELSAHPTPRRYQGRVMKWKQCIQTYGSVAEFAKKQPHLFTRRLYKGPPAQYRAEAWLYLSNWTGDTAVYTNLASKPLDPTIEISIEKDLDRTYPDHPYFLSTGRRALEELLKVFALSEADIGYVQGLNFVAGLCLLVTGGDCPKAYFVLKRLVKGLGLRGLYTENLPKLAEMTEMLHDQMEEMMPELRRTFEAEEVADGMWVTKWLLSLYASVLPLHVVLRVWDILLHQGPVFLLKVGLSLLKIGKNQLISCDCNEICNQLQTLAVSTGLDPESLMLRALKLKLRKGSRGQEAGDSRMEEEHANITAELPIQPQ
jgi:hypothetical protein